MNFRKKRSSRHSLESRRRQRLARNKRKREEKRLLKQGLTAVIQDLQEENESLTKKFNIEAAIKEKYFEMWRASEKEKDKIKNSQLIFRGCHQSISKEQIADKCREILKIDPSLLEDVEGTPVELGKGRFGTVFLKQFRSSPVAVNYFETSVAAKLVEKEASYLQQCCHINLPLIYGMNNNSKPFFIVTQFYGDTSFKPVTLKSAMKQEAEVSIRGLENWFHILTQLSDCLNYLHNKQIIHNDIKNDNVVITCSSKSFFSPILIDFGKACLISEARKKILTEEEKAKYYREHCHIAPEVIEGSHAQSVMSDMYSFGVMIASIYKYTKCRPLKELAKNCLKPVSSRCTSSELRSIILGFPVE